MLLSAFLRTASPFRVAERADALARIEIQKLAYLAQVLGGSAEHRFERGRYGPYSHGLERELKEWEGHFVLGYGDATDRVLELQPIRLMPDAVERAVEMVPADYGKVVDAVLEAVEGWESTYELELLATTLFTFIEGTASSAEQAYDTIASWSHIPSQMFTARHVAIAWEHLRSTGWLSEPAPVA